MSENREKPKISQSQRRTQLRTRWQLKTNRQQTAGSESERESTLSKHEKQTIKNITASINERENASKMDSNSDSDSNETSTIAFADKLPIKNRFVIP